MEFHVGDVFELFESPGSRAQNANLLVVTTNTATTTPAGRSVDPSRYGTMGAGVAKQAAERYPELPPWWAKQVAGGMRSGFRAMPHGGRWLGCMVTKNDWWKPSSLLLVEAGCRELRVWMDEHPEVKYALVPMPGTQNGGLSEQSVKPFLDRYFDARFIVCRKL